MWQGLTAKPRWASAPTLVDNTTSDPVVEEMRQLDGTYPVRDNSLGDIFVDVADGTVWIKQSDTVSDWVEAGTVDFGARM